RNARPRPRVSRGDARRGDGRLDLRRFDRALAMSERPYRVRMRLLVIVAIAVVAPWLAVAMAAPDTTASDTTASATTASDTTAAHTTPSDTTKTAARAVSPPDSGAGGDATGLPLPVDEIESPERLDDGSAFATSWLARVTVRNGHALVRRIGL